MDLGADLKGMERKVKVSKKLQAPIKKGDKVGVVKYYLNGQEVGSRELIASENVDAISYQSALVDTIEEWLL